MSPARWVREHLREPEPEPEKPEPRKSNRDRLQPSREGGLSMRPDHWSMHRHVVPAPWWVGRKGGSR